MDDGFTYSTYSYASLETNIARSIYVFDKETCTLFQTRSYIIHLKMNPIGIYLYFKITEH